MKDEITSDELGAQIAEEFQLTNAVGTQIVDFLSCRIRQHVQDGRRVELRRFLSIEPKNVSARKWRLKVYGEFQEGEIPEHVKAHVRVSQHFFNAVGIEPAHEEPGDFEDSHAGNE